ncbi:MAG: ABC transporter permease [Myxococcota bacterium]
MTYLVNVAGWELRRILRRPVFWIFVACTVAFKVWEVSQMVHVPYGPVLHNAPTNLNLVTLLMLYVIVIVVLPWLAGRVAGERFSGTRGWVDQGVHRPRTLRLARWIAIVLAACIVAASGVLTMRFLPPLLDPDPHAYGPFVPWSVLQSFVVFALLPIVAYAGLLLGLAERVRTPSSLYGVAVLFVGLWLLMKTLVPLADPGSLAHAVVSILEPFGTIADAGDTALWTPEELNTTRVPLSPLLLANRLFWVALGTLAWWWGPRRSRRPASNAPRRSLLGRFPALRRHVGSWTWRVGAIVLVVASGSTVRSVRRFSDTYPTTDVLVHDMEGLLRLVTLAWIVIATVRVFCLHDTLRTESWVRTAHGSPVRSALRELLAIFAAATLLHVVSGLALVTFQSLTTAGTPFHVDTPWLYPVELLGFQLPGTLQRGAFVIAAALATRRIWVVLVAAIAPGVLDQAALLAGIHSDLLRPGMTLDLDYSFMAGWNGLLSGHLSYTLHWTIGAGLLVALALRRWSVWTLHPPAPSARVLLAGAALFALSHAWILTNTALWNDFDPPTLDERMARYERAWGHVADLAQPVYAGGDYRVDFYPSEGRSEVEGTFTVRNLHQESIPDVHVGWHPHLRVARLEVSAPGEIERFDDTQHAVVHLAEPLPPGGSFTLSWNAATPPQRGFYDVDRRAPQTWHSEVRPLPNGTSILNLRFVPTLGYLRKYEHGAAWARSRFGLADDGGEVPDVNDPIARHTGHAASQLGRGRWTAVIGTEAPQRVLAAGTELERWEEGGRRYARYVLEDAPGWSYLLSGNYVRHASPGAELYAHPAHLWNVPAISERLAEVIAWHTETFGAGPPIRLAETSFHQGNWGALGGSAAASEIYVWKIDPRTGEAHIDDFVRYIVSRTWIRDRITPADVAGAKTMHRGMVAIVAEWCASELDQDPDAGRRRREQLVEEWIETRAQAVEPNATPLEVFRDSTGARSLLPLRMMRLRENDPEGFGRALRSFLRRYDGSGPPYVTARDLYGDLAAALPGPLLTRVFAPYAVEDVRLVNAASAGEGIEAIVTYRSSGVSAELTRPPLLLDWAIRDDAGTTLATGTETVEPGTHTLSLPRLSGAAEVVLDPDVWLADPLRRDNAASIR